MYQSIDLIKNRKILGRIRVIEELVNRCEFLILGWILCFENIENKKEYNCARILGSGKEGNC